MRILFLFAFIVAITLGITFTLNKKDVEKQDIVVTIKPIYGLVAPIVDGVAKVTLLMDPNTSPHVHDLTPKQINIINNIDLLITIGPSYEQTLQKYLPNTKGTIIVIDKIQNLKILNNRFNGNCKHSHIIDGHLWLDPDNAIIICNEILKKLIQIFPQHQEQLQNNTKQLINKINKLKQTIKEQMAKINNKNYLIYHDCLQYFDTAFGTQGIGVLVDEPGMPIKSAFFMQKYKKPPACLFVEPQFLAPTIQKIADKMKLPICTIDYLGTDVPLDNHAYINIMLSISKQIFHGLHDLKSLK